MKKICLTISLLIIWLLSCNKPDQATGLSGSWYWVKSTGGIANQTLTPENTGIERIMTFYTDDTVEVFENDSLVQKVDYYIRPEKSLLYQDTFQILTVNYRFRLSGSDSVIILPMRFIIREISMQLVLEEDVFDGYTHTYIRKD